MVRAVCLCAALAFANCRGEIVEETWTKVSRVCISCELVLGKGPYTVQAGGKTLFEFEHPLPELECESVWSAPPASERVSSPFATP